MVVVLIAGPALFIVCGILLWWYTRQEDGNA